MADGRHVPAGKDGAPANETMPAGDSGRPRPVAKRFAIGVRCCNVLGTVRVPAGTLSMAEGAARHTCVPTALAFADQSTFETRLVGGNRLVQPQGAIDLVQPGQ